MSPALLIHRPDSVPLAIVLFLAMVAGGAGLYLFTMDNLLQVRQQRAKGNEALHAAQTALRELPGEMAQLRAAEADFRTMTQRGFIGAGERIHWISTLARINQEPGPPQEAGKGLQTLAWQLDSQQPHNDIPHLWSTPMVLRAAPLSPQGLGALLDHLAAGARGRFTVDTCTLSASQGGGQVECHLSWWNWHADEMPETTLDIEIAGHGS